MSAADAHRANAAADVDVEHVVADAPCGLLSMDPGGTITFVNHTFLDWCGFAREDVVGVRSFASLLTGGGRIYHETHYAPMLRMEGRADEIALDIVDNRGKRVPVLVSSILDRDEHGQPVQIRAAVFRATERRRYEQELLREKQRAEASEEHARLLSRTLQQTLIPHAVPVVAGLDLAAVYRPAGDGEEIGGDFYDVFQLSQGDWVVAIGDVQGKGVEAAVVTAVARYTIRAAAVEHERPSEVLRVVNDVLRIDATMRFCTAALVRCRRDGDRWHVQLCAAGHPLPLLVRDGTCSEVGKPGTLLGIFPDVALVDEEVWLDSTMGLVLYTDGVTEARAGAGFFGEGQLAAFLAARSSAPISEVAASLLDELLAFQSGSPQDDIAIVAFRPQPITSEPTDS